MKRWVPIIVLLIVILVIGYLIYQRPPVVEVAEVRRNNLEIELFTTGVVESEMADVASRIVAPISRLFVQEGQTVTTNQRLAVLDRAELLAQVDEARAALGTTQEQLAQAQETVRVAATQATAAVARAEAGMRAARARLADIMKGARPQEIEQARAAVRQARLEAELAQTDFERAQLLFQQGAISAQQLDTARTAAQVAASQVQAAEEQLSLVEAGARPEQVRVARADVEAAESALTEAKATEQVVAVRRREAAAMRAQVERARAAVDAAEARLEFASVRSPLVGIVARRHLEEGEMASPQTPIYTLARLDPIWVTAEVDEDDLAALGLGQRVVITSGAFPGRRVEGRIVRVSPIAEPKAVGLARARIVRARTEIDSTQFEMKPGMEVDITGRAVVARDVILVPNNALVRIGERSQVYVVEANRLYPRDVETGLSSFDFTEITAGLMPGEVVATTLPPDPEAGQFVRVRRPNNGH